MRIFMSLSFEVSIQLFFFAFLFSIIFFYLLFALYVNDVIIYNINGVTDCCNQFSLLFLCIPRILDL